MLHVGAPLQTFIVKLKIINMLEHKIAQKKAEMEREGDEDKIPY
jgi:hypothetical protein